MDELVNRVVTELESRLNKPGVFILASPGCSRGSLVTALLRRGSVDAVYAYDKFGSKVGEDVRGRVNEFRKIDELVGKLGSANGRVVVVTRSTTDAVRLRDKLGKAEVIYLPEYYEDAAKKVLKGVDLEVARVRHEGLGEGISPSLLREGLPGKDVQSIRELSPGKGDLKDVIRDFLKKAPIDVATQAVTAGLSFLLGVGAAVSLVGSLVGRFLESVVGRLRKNKDEITGGFVRLLRVAREVNKNYLDDKDKRLRDERLEAVFDEVAYEWGLNIEEFTGIITNIANLTEGKQLTEEDIKKLINDNLESIAKELNEVKSKVEGLLVGAKVFYIYDVENGLLYGNFTVEGGVPKIETWVGKAKNEQNKQSEQEPPPKTDLVDAGKFRKVAEEVFSKLVKDGRVVLVGPRGIGKSTLATYVTWRSLFGSLGSVALDKPMDALIRVDSLNPGDALELNNLIKVAGRRFVVIYDPSPIKAYYKPEAMQVVEHGNKSVKNITLRELVESVKNTLKELMEVRNAWVVVILPRELYDEVSKSEELGNTLNEIKSYIIDVDLKNEEFLREVIKRYSGCDNVSDDLVRRVMNFDSYTLVAKYVGIWLHEKKCEVEDVEKALRESADKPKLFFANYIWGTILGKSMDLAMKVSVPLILHATFGPIPEGITYITKAVNEGGVWKLIDRDRLAESKLEDLREDDLEPIAKWLSTLHEDLIEETLRELVGLHGEEARNNYENHGFENLIKTLNSGYHEKALEEVRGLSREVKPEEVESNLLIFVGERLKQALKPYTDCFKRAAFIIGLASAGIPIVPKLKDLRIDVVESLGNALKECDVDVYLLIGDEIPPLIRYLTKHHAYALIEAFVDKYDEAVAEIKRVLYIARKWGRGSTYDAEGFYGLGLASIIAKAIELGKPSDANATFRIVSSAIQHVASTDLIKPILSALVPLRDKAPKRYLEVLVSALDKVSRPDILGYLRPDLDAVMYILNEFDYILNKYGDGVKGRAWTLVLAIDASINSLYRYLELCDDYSNYWDYWNASLRTELEHIASRVAGLLNEIDRLNPSLGIIAWAHALLPALENKCVRALMESVLGVDVVNKKAKEVDEKLSGLSETVQELIRDEDFMGFVESWLGETDEEAVRGEILEESSNLKYALAQYKLDNDELYEAEELFNKAARERWEIGDYERYLDYSNWALRAKAIRSKLAGDKLVELVNGFRQLYEEAKKQSGTVGLSVILDWILGGYLVSLALKGGDGEIRRIEELLREVFKKEWRGPGRHSLDPILTRLTLNALLSPRGELSGELKDRLFVKPGEFILAFGGIYIDFNSLPALRAIYGTIKPGDEKRLCDESIDHLLQDLCMHQVLRVINDSEKLDQRGEGNLRQGLINDFQRWISKGEVLDLLKKLGLDAESLKNELEGLIHELSGKSLPELVMFCSEREQRRCSSAHLAYMLYALINGNEKLAKAHALYGAVSVAGKLPARLFLKAYKECCDLKNESFRRAIARLFFYNV
ncbi:hypothetical protein DDW10_03565 [Sulfolobales archaeon SCGC AB-777_J03]|nr:hypothetical protein DDW10_03565 [Sulfolobales archaeon SCGC AB-777_J03]